MKVSILEIFFLFWSSAILWVLVEYFYYRLSRKGGGKPGFDQYKGN
jgi:hypothetical protein